MYMNNVIKRTLVVLAAFLPIVLLTALRPVTAQNLPLTVENIAWWDPDYPTVTWSGAVRVDGDGQKAVDYIAGLLPNAKPADKSYKWNISDSFILLGSRLVSVDGRDMRGASVNRVNEILSEPGNHKLRLSHATEGDYEAVINTELPMWMQAYGFHPLTCTWEKNSLTPPENIVIRMDRDVKWRNFKTYDLLILSDDVLADKELLEKIGDQMGSLGLRRNTENPDILITITKDANKSVEYTYVPETTEHVQTGTNTYAMYGYKGHYLGNFSVNKYQTVTSGGYTHKSATTTVYLEVSMLEASRIGEKVLPMVYQMKYNFNRNSDENVDKLYSNAVEWVQHPLFAAMPRLRSTTCTRYLYGKVPLINFGIVVDADGVVRGIDSNSDVVKKSGIRTGDRILRIKCTQRGSMRGYRGKDAYSGSITVQRDGAEQTLSFANCHRTNAYSMTFSGIYNVVK